jgi:hypothetical protein
LFLWYKFRKIKKKQNYLSSLTFLADDNAELGVVEDRSEPKIDEVGMSAGSFLTLGSLLTKGFFSLFSVDIFYRISKKKTNKIDSKNKRFRILIN